MNQTEDFINQPFTFQNTVDFLDNIEDGAGAMTRPNAGGMNEANGFNQDWAQSYGGYNDNDDLAFFPDANTSSPSDGDQSTHNFNLDMYNHNVDMVDPVLALPDQSNRSPISPAGKSTVSSDSDMHTNQNNDYKIADLPTPPPNYVNGPPPQMLSGGTQHTPDQSPGGQSVDSANYTTKVKLESVSDAAEFSPTDAAVEPSTKHGSTSASKRATKAKGSKVSKPRKEKTSHNMIEKRYRTNINDKIAALRECVPALRCALGGGNANEDLEGLTPASKLNKATVLTKATEYINHLQHKNDILEQRVNELQAKLGQYTNIDLSGSSSASSVSAYNMPVETPQFSAYPQQAPYEMKSRFLMGSLAGMMTTGLFQEMSDNTQALSGFPILGMNLPFVNIPLFTMMKIMVIMGAVAWILSPVFQKPVSKSPKTRRFDFYTTTKMRKQVWDITSKSLGIPDDDASGIGMAVAVFYAILGAIVQPSLNSIETSWSRAIDAQLCGGDSEVSRSRLLITFVKSLVLKQSARRFMRQAIHAKVLFKGFPAVADYISAYFWNKAKSVKGELADHQAALLDSNVLDDRDTMQRVYNLTMNYALNYKIKVRDDDAIEGVLRDQTLRSIVDISCAWYACKLMHEVLLSGLEDHEIDFTKIEQAKSVVPPESITSQRVAVIQALLLGTKDSSLIKQAMDLISQEVVDNEEEELANGEYPPLVNNRRTIPQDMQLAIHCAFIKHFINLGETENALELAKRLVVYSTEDLGLLGFVAVWVVSTELSQQSVKDPECRLSLENLAASARVWIGSEPGEKVGVCLEKRRDLVGQCLDLSVKFGQASDELDEGYGCSE